MTKQGDPYEPDYRHDAVSVVQDELTGGARDGLLALAGGIDWLVRLCSGLLVMAVTVTTPDAT
jgi:hypothetical protein